VQVTVLGPQRRTSAARTAVRELIPDGPIATVNAGWQEREADTDELNDVLDGRMTNLELHRRWRQLLDDDPDYAAAERRLTERLAGQQEIYAIRLGYALAAAADVSRRSQLADVRTAAEADAVAALQHLDRWHLGRVAEIRAEFYAGTRIGDRDTMAVQRAELRDLVGASAGLVVTGGHVGVLLHLLHIFGMAAVIRPPLITWSAGAMALSDRVVLFHDQGPPGRQHPEVYAEGLGAYSGVLPFPHPKRRLRLGDHGQLQLLARRFAPRVCLLLPDGVRVDLRPGHELPPGARWVDEDGQVIIEDGDG
jgi:hypothetical protein